MGSPLATDTRTMAPTNSLMAFGRSVFLMNAEFAAAVGQVCHPTSMLPINCPLARSVFATSTSTVSIGATAALTGSGSWPPRASNAATPPAASATPRTTRRAAFITLHIPLDAAAGVAVIAGFHQLNVKAWLMRRI
jgi:hypothetical protein